MTERGMRNRIAERLLVLITLLAACGEPVSSPSGQLIVENATTGGAFDPDGFVLRMATVAPTSLDLNKTRVLQGLPTGTYQVELTDLAPNCRPQDGATRNVSIREKPATRIHFEVVCTPPPELARLRIFFARSRNSWPFGTLRIVAMNADGSGSLDITSGKFSDAHPDVSPDGRRIVFESNRDNDPRGHPKVHLMNMDGSAHTVLTAGPAHYPDWSPDGRQVALGWPVGSYGAAQIMTLNAEGSGGAQALTMVLDTRAEIYMGDFRPAWSPDGTRVAFLRADGTLPGEGVSLWMVDADGSEETRLTGPSLDASASPVWSPDGLRIAFSDHEGPPGAGTSRTYAIGVDGSERVTLMEAQGPSMAVTDWSADGKYLLLGRSNDVYLFRLVDRTLMRLTADGTSRDTGRAKFWPSAPRSGIP